MYISTCIHRSTCISVNISRRICIRQRVYLHTTLYIFTHLDISPQMHIHILSSVQMHIYILMIGLRGSDYWCAEGCMRIPFASITLHAHTHTHACSLSLSSTHALDRMPQTRYFSRDWLCVKKGICKKIYIDRRSGLERLLACREMYAYGVQRDICVLRAEIYMRIACKEIHAYCVQRDICVWRAERYMRILFACITPGLPHTTNTIFFK